MIKRTETKQIKIKNLVIGGQNKVLIQSMTNTKTKDIQATITQIRALQSAGCEIVRLAVLDEEDALAIAEIKKEVSCPLVADIHFNYKLALIAIESGVDKIRINPGNIGSLDRVKAVMEACLAKRIPIRIGINAGSLEKELLEKYTQPCAAAMIESAQKQVSLLESLGFYDIALSFKSSDVRLSIETYRLAAQTFVYPLHIGVTEAGPTLHSAIKSSAALGPLLYDGIGDTIRVSVADDPLEEIKIAKHLLKAFDLIDNVSDLIACPTCGRLQYDMLPYVKEIEKFLETIQSDITVAVMGCPVNGIQEAARADIGIAGGKNEGLLFKKGELIKRVKQEELVDTLKDEILKMINPSPVL